MDLDELRAWHDRLGAEPDSPPFEVTWRAPAEGHAKSSACLGLEAPARLGALTPWDSGQLAAAVVRMRAWGTGTEEERSP